jgi:SAM-dependent methyltransferase
VAVPGTNPFAGHPLRRYDFAWRHLAGVPGPHLDLGAGFGDFAGPFAASTGRDVSTVDAMPGYVDEIASRFPAVHAEQLTTEGRIPFSDGVFTSVSLLDVLEHAADERLLLTEAHRVLADDGLIVVTVPRRHVFSWLDPDNVKFRWPRVHRAIYRRRFGDAAYERRFADQGDGFVGDIASNRGWHTNYRTDDVLHLLEAAGFTPESVEGANLFWRWLHAPYLLGGRRTKRLLGPAIRVDGDLFTSPRISANLFIVARKRS